MNETFRCSGGCDNGRLDPRRCYAHELQIAESKAKTAIIRLDERKVARGLLGSDWQTKIKARIQDHVRWTEQNLGELTVGEEVWRYGPQPGRGVCWCQTTLSAVALDIIRKNGLEEFYMPHRAWERHLRHRGDMLDILHFPNKLGLK